MNQPTLPFQGTTVLRGTEPSKPARKPAREVVLDLFQNSPRERYTITDLVRIAKYHGHTYSRSAVWRAVGSLESENRIHHVERRGGKDYFLFGPRPTWEFNR